MKSSSESSRELLYLGYYGISYFLRKKSDIYSTLSL